jgi:hypothetical protein
VGLILPAALDIAPVLVPLAASGALTDEHSSPEPATSPQRAPGCEVAHKCHSRAGRVVFELGTDLGVTTGGNKGLGFEWRGSPRRPRFACIVSTWLSCPRSRRSSIAPRTLIV